ncbi:MAG: hypothetical protein KKB59_19830 [Spirochaetes bacterium]|nr:hypothetical protein [Spirochaetota bacterium]
MNNCINYRQMFLEWRDIEHMCHKCGGSGKYTYPSSATWHGGIGGQVLTNDVCDKCWGSGDEINKGANLKMLFSRIKNLEWRIEECASIIDRELGDTDPYLDEDMTSEDIKRDEPLFWVHRELCKCLSKYPEKNI